MADALTPDECAPRPSKMPIRSPPPEILETATEIVDEVIAKAQLEYKNRKEKEPKPVEQELGGLAGILKRSSRWHNRARGIVTRILTHLRICK